MNQFNEFFSGHFIRCLIVKSAVSLKNLQSQAIEIGVGGSLKVAGHLDIDIVSSLVIFINRTKVRNDKSFIESLFLK